MSGPEPKVVHVQPAPPFEVAQVTVRHSQSVPAIGQSRSAQQTAFVTSAGEHAVVFGVSVPEGTLHRHDFWSLGTTHVVDAGGVSPAGPVVETFPHGLSHCASRQVASASLAGDPVVG